MQWKARRCLQMLLWAQLRGWAYIEWWLYHYLRMNPVDHPWFAYLWLSIEVSFALYGAMRLFHLTMFFTMFSLLWTLFSGQFIENANHIKRVIAQHRRFRFVPHRYDSFLWSKFDDCTNIYVLAINASNVLFGGTIFACILTTIPINIYYIRRTFFAVQPCIQKVAESIVIVIQIISYLIIFTPFAWCCAVYHSPKTFIPKLQSMLHGNQWIIFKLKLNDIFDRLVRGPKIAINIGPTKEITYATSLEVWEFLKIYLTFLIRFNKSSFSFSTLASF